MEEDLTGTRPAEERSYDLGAVRLHVLAWNARAGSGPPVLLLHGLTGTATRSWGSVAPRLARLLPDRPIYVPDLRGHGASDRPHTGYTIEDFAADVQALIALLPGGQAGVVGHSLGALAALLAAVEQPAGVWRLVLVDPPLDSRGAPAMQVVIRTAAEQLRLAALPERELDALLRQRSPGLTDRAIGLLASKYRTTAPEALREAAEDLWGVDLDAALAGEVWSPELRIFMEGYLPAVTCPTLIVQADPTVPGMGSVLPPGSATRALALLPDARLVTYQGIGHLVNIEASQRLADDIANWLAA